MNERGNSEGLLGGYRALDLSGEWGMYCGKILGDLGADVIKVEPPGGDPVRNIGPFYKGIPDPNKSFFWFSTNTSKRGITLNIETAEGRDIFKQLVKTADFVIESFEPGYMASLGLGYPDLEKINTRVIVTSITPFGQSGPYANFKSTDIVLMAMGGAMYFCGDPERAPVRISAPQTRFLGGTHGASGTMVAHYYREIAGVGQHVDVSIQEACIMVLQNAAETWDLLKTNIIRRGQSSWRARVAKYGPLVQQTIFQCKDGYVRAALWGGQAGVIRSCQELTRWADREGLAGEFRAYDWSKYDGSTMLQDERDRLDATFRSFFATKTKRELMEAAVEKGLVIGPLSNVKDLWESPHFQGRRYWVDIEHPELNDVITYPGPGVRISEMPWRIRRRPPLIGEHNKEVYQALGYSPEQLAVLKAGNVI